MSPLNRLQLRLSEIRSELRKIAESDSEITAETRESVDTLKRELEDTETRYQAALLVDNQVQEKVESVDAESRERVELRSRVRLIDILKGARSGRQSTVIKEYQESTGSGDNEIPFDLFEGVPETRATTPAPSSGTGINVQRIIPAVFSESVAPGLMIDMPQVKSGTSSWMRITTNQSAGFQAKGSDQAATAGAFTSVTTTPHRLSARLELVEEDIQSVGIDSFESMLQSNLMMTMSDVLDKAILRGSGATNEISGLITSKGAPTAETTTETWLLARQKVIDLQDGIWARSMSDIGLLLGVDTMKTFDNLFPATTAGVVPRESLSMNLKALLNSYMSSAQMPDQDSTGNHQTAVACLKGKPGESIAVCPRWSEISITDIYSGSARAETSYNLHVLIGDVLLLHPAAYQNLSFKLS